MHFDFFGAVALAIFAAATLHIETEPAGIIAAVFGFLSLSEQFTDQRKNSGVSSGVRSRRPADGQLIDADYFINILKPDNFFMSAYTRQKGTSWLAIGAGIIGMLVGSILWNPILGLLFSFGVVFLVELIRFRDVRKASMSLKNMLVGCGWTAVVRFGIGFLMIGLWVIWYTLR